MDRQTMIEFILDHYERPRNRGSLADATVTMKGGNPGCGDIITLYVKLDEDDALRIMDIAFEGEGCTISQAAASLLTEKVKGKPLAEATLLDAGDFVDELGMELVANRLKCATLALNTLKAAEKKYRDAQLRGAAASAVDSDEVVNF